MPGIHEELSRKHNPHCSCWMQTFLRIALVLLNGMDPLLFTLTTAQWKQYRRPIQEREPSLKLVVSVQSSEIDDVQYRRFFTGLS